MEEGEGESSSPARPLPGGPSPHDAICNDIYDRLIDSGNDEAVFNPNLRDLLESHLARLPLRYGLDLNMDRVEDVLLHQKILADAEDPEKRPIFFVRFMKCIWTSAYGNDGQQQSVDSTGEGSGDRVHERIVAPNLRRNGDQGIEFEPCSKLEDLNLDVRDVAQDDGEAEEALSARQDIKDVPVHEIIFSSIDKPKLLSQLSALLADIGLNIREAHVFSTTDGYSLDWFEVDGWPEEETEGLIRELDSAVANNEGSLSGASLSSASDKALASLMKVGDWEIDKRCLKMGKKIACGSCGDLYRATYLGQDVAVKILKAEKLNEAMALEFNQEVEILRKVHHNNVVSFIGACTKPNEFCIVTEYMTGGNLYDYLHKDHMTLELPQLLKFAIDICKGMDYLHENNIIHRDLKTANLLMDANNVVKVADFGVARFQNEEGIMTAETGTYRWMAPEVINHQLYDHKADVFSFAIVLWELATSRVPYEKMSPLQAALGVRQGLRPDPPNHMHPRLQDLMQRCWDSIPGKRPSFKEITGELEELLQLVQASVEASVQ
ncbi:serine/threonine-protein kinase STY17-like isoform X1 [Zingiber officinale]|uniref:serine/threonine-protein kinase STY17-like isoform X1 n=1 Tax=Zingiber officinale TaxID=94328 RepID=UPI001C4C60B3|nr:serine/threonine-protein kinase STY17-like isoform X1 [Zingiber officinale]